MTAKVAMSVQDAIDVIAVMAVIASTGMRLEVRELILFDVRDSTVRNDAVNAMNTVKIVVLEKDAAVVVVRISMFAVVDVMGVMRVMDVTRVTSLTSVMFAVVVKDVTTLKRRADPMTSLEVREVKQHILTIVVHVDYGQIAQVMHQDLTRLMPQQRSLAGSICPMVI